MYKMLKNIIFAVSLQNDLYCFRWGVKLYSLTHCAVSTLCLVYFKLLGYL